MKKSILAIFAVVGLIAWSCTKVETSSGLKQSVEKGVANISYAVSKISGSTGYQLLSINDVTTKSDFSFSDTINLSMVAGIYDFQPDTVFRYHEFFSYKLFKKTGESENMVVNLPEMMVMHPKHLQSYEPVDTVYPNNFTITATDYQLHYNWWHNYEYRLKAGLTLNDEDAGSVDVSETSLSWHSNSYSSKFTFNDGYNIAAVWQDGDTATSAFSLSKDNDTLFKESSMIVRNEYMKYHNFHNSEKYYSLTIGDVELKKSIGIDSLQVFVNGILQQNAAQIITEESDTTASICHMRDILLTYDDGTTAKLSDLMSPVLEQLDNLSDSLHSMFFSKHIINYIAFSIYYNNHEFHY
jgi:hypothetical protein